MFNHAAVRRVHQPGDTFFQVESVTYSPFVLVASGSVGGNPPYDTQLCGSGPITLTVAACEGAGMAVMVAQAADTADYWAGKGVTSPQTPAAQVKAHKKRRPCGRGEKKRPSK